MDPITTDTVPARERLDFWADLISRQVNPMRIEAAGDQTLRGRAQPRAMAGFTLSVVSGQGIRAVHGRAEVARTDSHVHIACIHLGGEARITHRDEEICLRRGDVFLTDSRHRFTLGLENRWKHLVVVLPTHWLDARLTRPELVSGAVLRDLPLARLWAGHLADGYALADALSPAAATLFTQHSVELLAQALEERHHLQPGPSEAWRAALFLRAYRSIAREFGNPALRPDRVAAELGVSTRTLERIFAERGKSIMRCIYDERIRQAARLLTEAGAAHRSVTEIGFACGFNDASHFGRAFAARMHMTPSQWRLQGAGLVGGLLKSGRLLSEAAAQG